MAMEANPDFRVNIYGDDPSRVHDLQRDMALGGPRGGGTGFPWFRGRTPSPYNPNAPVQHPNPVTQEPPPDASTPPPPGLFGNMSAREIAALIAALTSAVGGAVSGRGQDYTPTSATTDPAMAELLALMSGRLKKSEPLYDSVLNMANGLLPTQYQKGGGGGG